MNLILLEPDEAANPAQVVLTGGRAAHVRTILKAAPGQQIRVGIVDGPMGLGTVTATTPEAVTLDCVFDAARPEAPRVDLLLALPRPKVLKRLWAQITALGVDRVMLTNAARVERNYFDTHLLHEHGFRPLLIEGLQQARDTRLPTVTVHRQLKVLVEDELGDVPSGYRRLYGDPQGLRWPAQALGNPPPARVLLAVGPEGGWVHYERTLLERHGFVAVTLGARVLRADTACVALLALVRAALEGR